MGIARPIPGWVPATPEVRGGAFDDLVQRHPAIAIHFWAPWNGSDPPMDHSIQAIAAKFAGRIAFFSCNIDLEDNHRLCKQCRLSNIPTLAVWVSGAFRRPIVGCREPEQLAVEIESRLKPDRIAPPRRWLWRWFFRDQ